MAMTRQEHLLIILAEECAEVQQAATKALRFGLKEGRDIPGDNEVRLNAELNDLLAVIEMLIEDGVHLKTTSALVNFKKTKVEKYLNYPKSCGTLE